MYGRRRVVMIAMAAVGAIVCEGTRAQEAASAAVYSIAQATAGARLFASHCAACHGEDLSGTQYGPGLTRVDLRGRWKGRTLGDLFSLMRSSMPLTSPAGLNERENTDLLAFLLQQASIPAGSTELPADAATLAKIPFPIR